MLFETRQAIEDKKAWEWYNNVVQKSFTLFGKSSIIEKYSPEQPRDPETGRFLSADGGESGSTSTVNTGETYAKEIVNTYFDNPKALGETTHQEKFDDFKAHGVDVQPLNRGNHEGRLYEEGGGYKVVINEDGKTFLYHPKEGSHHGGEYYKLSSGKTGKTRYDMMGNKKEE